MVNHGRIIDMSHVTLKGRSEGVCILRVHGFAYTCNEQLDGFTVTKVVYNSRRHLFSQED